MHTWLLIAFAAVALLFSAMTVYSFALAWRGAMADREPLLFDEMMSRRGISRAEAPALMPGREIAVAERRCVLCSLEAALPRLARFGAAARARVVLPQRALPRPDGAAAARRLAPPPLRAGKIARGGAVSPREEPA